VAALLTGLIAVPVAPVVPFVAAAQVAQVAQVAQAPRPGLAVISACRVAGGAVVTVRLTGTGALQRLDPAGRPAGLAPSMYLLHDLRTRRYANAGIRADAVGGAVTATVRLPGHYRAGQSIRLRVAADDSGDTALEPPSAAVAATVRACREQPPVARFRADTDAEPHQVWLDARTSAGLGLSYTWSRRRGGTWHRIGTASLLRLRPAPGTAWIVRLVIRDRTGRASSLTRSFVVPAG
jgi:hypothetical protein